MNTALQRALRTAWKAHVCLSVPGTVWTGEEIADVFFNDGIPVSERSWNTLSGEAQVAALDSVFPLTGSFDWKGDRR